MVPLIFLLLINPVISLALLTNDITPDLRPCPSVKPRANFDINQLKGKWHLNMLVFDAATEDFEDTDICITGDIKIVNSTTFHQNWEVYSSLIAEEPTASFDLLTNEVRPGVWTVRTPLGGEIKAAVVDCNPDKYIIVSHCGWNRGKLVHLWTGGASRSPVLTQKLRHRFALALEAQGYQPSQTHVITWTNTC